MVSEIISGMHPDAWGILIVWHRGYAWMEHSERAIFFSRVGVPLNSLLGYWPTNEWHCGRKAILASRNQFPVATTFQMGFGRSIPHGFKDSCCGRPPMPPTIRRWRDLWTRTSLASRSHGPTQGFYNSTFIIAFSLSKWARVVIQFIRTQYFYLFVFNSWLRFIKLAITFENISPLN